MSTHVLPAGKARRDISARRECRIEKSSGGEEHCDDETVGNVAVESLQHSHVAVDSCAIRSSSVNFLDPTNLVAGDKTALDSMVCAMMSRRLDSDKKPMPHACRHLSITFAGPDAMAQTSARC